MTDFVSNMSAVVLLFACVNIAYSAASSSPKNVCTSRECEILSGRIYRMMDTSVDPCDNFEQFTCGGYRQYRFSGANKRIGFAKDLSAQFKDMAKEMLTTDEPINAKSQGVKNLYAIMRIMYKKCTESFHDHGFDKTLENIIFKEIGRYGGTIDANENLGKFLGKLFNSLTSVVMAKARQMDFIRDPSGNLLLEVDLNLFADSHIIRRFAQELLNHRVLEKLAKKSLQFMHTSHIEKWNEVTSSSCQFKLSDLKNGYLFNFTEFSRYFKLLKNTQKLENVTVKLKNCVTYLKFVNRYGRKETFKSYLAIKSLHYVFEKFFSRNLKEDCLDKLSGNFVLLFSEMFKQKYIQFDDKKEAETVVNKLIDSAATLARQQPWLDETSLNNYVQRLKVLSATYGYPRKLTEAVLRKLAESPISRLEIYRDMSIEEFIKNLLHLSDAYNIALLGAIKDEKSLVKFFETNILLYKNYYRSYQAINAEEAFLVFTLPTEFPFMLSPTIPDYLKLSAYGFIAGHEIGHNLKFPSPKHIHFTNASLNKYHKKVECIRSVYQEEYAKVFSVSDETALAYSSRTMNENIADFTADSMFFEAAFGLKSRKQKMKMPGPLSSYTPEQVFFIHRLQIFCSKFSLNAPSKPSNKHSPLSMRVNMTSKNSRHFAEAFQCKPGSPMNPLREKCVIL